jgi:putative transposase
MTPISFKRHRFSPVIIQHAVWLYARFTLSFRDVEELLTERGVDVSNERIRRWFLKFGRLIAGNLRGDRPHANARRHLGEMVTRSVAGNIGCGARSMRLSAVHDQGLRANNRAKNSHQPVRRQERKQQRFKAPGSAQRFLSIHAAVYNAFYVQRHLLPRRIFKEFRAGTFAVWQQNCLPA